MNTLEGKIIAGNKADEDYYDHDEFGVVRNNGGYYCYIAAAAAVAVVAAAAVVGGGGYDNDYCYRCCSC